jgi:hypothetical protein
MLKKGATVDFFSYHKISVMYAIIVLIINSIDQIFL